MSREDLHFRLRIPPALKAEVAESAQANNRSMTAEIIARLEGGAETLRDKAALAVFRTLVAGMVEGNVAPQPRGGEQRFAPLSREAYTAADAFMAARSGASS